MRAAIQDVDAEVVGHTAPTPQCRRLALRVPRPFGSRPGQFVHVRCAGEQETAPLLRRPFSIYTEAPDGHGAIVEILYTVVGVGTARLAQLRVGECVRIMGPLGTWFRPPTEARRCVLVAGGVGIVPFLHLVRLWRRPAVLLFGSRTVGYLHDLRAWERLDVEVRVATEDGSAGCRGRVTDLLRKLIQSEGGRRIQVYTCGPEAMLGAVIRMCRRAQVPCQASLERRMGCALGACGACATPVHEGRSWRYSRICIEGPVYDAARLVLGER